MSPLVLPTLVIAGNGIDGLVAYDRTSGREVWRLDVRGGVEGGAAISEGRLYFGANDGFVYCIDALTGRTFWTFQAHAEALAPPTVFDKIVYVQTGADVLYALEAGSGKPVWTYNRQIASNFSIRANTRPVVDSGMVFAGFSDGFLAAVRIRDGGLIWERKLGFGQRFRDVDATPVVEDETLYASSFDGALYSLNKRTGAVNWQSDEGAYVPVTLGPGDALYYSSTSGKVMRLDKRSGKTVWSKKVAKGKGIATQPVLYKGYLLFGESDGALQVVEAGAGGPIARFETGHGLTAKPAVVDATGETFLMSNGANLYALRVGMVLRSDRLPWDPPP